MSVGNDKKRRNNSNLGILLFFRYSFFFELDEASDGGFDSGLASGLDSDLDSGFESDFDSVFGPDGLEPADEEAFL